MYGQAGVDWRRSGVGWKCRLICGERLGRVVVWEICCRNLLDIVVLLQDEKWKKADMELQATSLSGVLYATWHAISEGHI